MKQGTRLFAVYQAVSTTDGWLDRNGIGLFGINSLVPLNARWGQVDQTAADTGTYLFARYVADRFGGSSAFARVFAAGRRGIAAYDALFRSDPRPSTFADVFGDWIAANFLGDPTLEDGRFGYRGNLQVTPTVQPGPMLTTSVAGHASQFGTTYYEIKPSAAATLTFTGVRLVRLVGADPHDGSYEWWGNRGDEIDSRLTCVVDLRAVPAASLHFWTWFNISKDFDYSYVEVSIDGGVTWRTLSTPETTQDSPNGANLGDGFTGTSGGTSPGWIQETSDLTPYAGHEILLRFEYVTNPTAEGDGFVVDGVEIPEIGFHDDTASDNGWIAEGFVRTDNAVPQIWLVEAITPDPTNPVRQPTISPDRTGSLALAAGQSSVVAVAGLSAETNQSSKFQLRLVPR